MLTSSEFDLCLLLYVIRLVGLSKHYNLSHFLFTHSLTHSLIHSLTCSFVCSFDHAFILPFVKLFIHLFIYLFIHSFVLHTTFLRGRYMQTLMMHMCRCPAHPAAAFSLNLWLHAERIVGLNHWVIGCWNKCMTGPIDRWDHSAALSQNIQCAKMCCVRLSWAMLCCAVLSCCAVMHHASL